MLSLPGLIGFSVTPLPTKYRTYSWVPTETEVLVHVGCLATVVPVGLEALVFEGCTLDELELLVGTLLDELFAELVDEDLWGLSEEVDELETDFVGLADEVDEEEELTCLVFVFLGFSVLVLEDVEEEVLDFPCFLALLVELAEAVDFRGVPFALDGSALSLSQVTQWRLE